MTGNVDAGNLRTGGVISATGNITGGNLSGTSIVGTLTTAAQTNITSVGALSSLSVTGNIDAGNLRTAGILRVNSGNSTGTVIENAGANTVGNIGSTSNYFGNAHITALRALYADLAESYAADAEYEPGTVLSFGGSAEVTISMQDGDRRVAGVISTNPSYQMNAGLESDHVAVIALQGRVPAKVLGPVSKGDLMVSAGNGHARSDSDPKTGTIIGKSLEDFNGLSGIIEIAVGRL